MPSTTFPFPKSSRNNGNRTTESRHSNSSDGHVLEDPYEPKFANLVVTEVEAAVESVSATQRKVQEVTRSIGSARFLESQQFLQSEWSDITTAHGSIVAGTKKNATDISQAFERYTKEILPVVYYRKLQNRDKVFSPQETLAVIRAHLSLAQKRGQESQALADHFLELCDRVNNFCSRFSGSTSNDLRELRESLRNKHIEIMGLQRNLILHSCEFVGSTCIVGLCQVVTFFSFAVPFSQLAAPLQKAVTKLVLLPSGSALSGEMESLRKTSDEEAAIKRKLKSLDIDHATQAYVSMYESAKAFEFTRRLWKNYIQQLEELQTWVQKKIDSPETANESNVPLSISKYSMTGKSQYDSLVGPLSKYAQEM